MASGMDKLAKELRNMMSSADERKPKPYDAQAEVLRIEDNIAWVHIPGGVEETPVKLTINAKKGDMVNIHVANGSAWITGNGTNPPTDDTTANYALEQNQNTSKSLFILNEKVTNEFTNAWSEIRQNSDEIQLKVSAEDYNGEEIVSLINVQPDTVKIHAKNVEIDGTAIFNNSDFQTALDAEDFAISDDIPTKVSDLTNDSGYQTASQVSSTVSSGVSGKADKTDAIARQQRIYYRKTASGAPSKNTTWLSTSGTGYGNWSLKIPPLTNGSTKYPYLYTAVQTQTVSQQAAGSTCSCSDVLLDDSTTVIDGGNIITGSVTANQIAADTITANKIRIGDYNNYVTVTENDASSIISGQIVDGWVCKNVASNNNLWVSPVLNNWTKAGENYRVTGFVKMPAEGKFMLCIYGRADDPPTYSAISQSQMSWMNNIPADTVTPINSVITITSNTANCPKVNICVYFRTTSDSPQVGYIKQLRVERMSDSELIVDGSITTDKIAANTITIGKIDSTAQSQILNSEVQVGGRNLFINSKLRKSGSSNGISFAPSGSGEQYCRIYGTASDTVDQWVADLQYLSSYTNLTVTISVNAVFTDSANNYFYVSTSKNGAWYKDYQKITWYSSTERRLTINLENGETLRYLRVHLVSGTTVDGAYRVKVELGNKQTDWSPAPEDIEGGIAATDTNMLLDWDAQSVIAEKAKSTRYWGGNSSTTTQTFFTVTDPPEANIHYGGRVTLSSSQTSDFQTALCFYSGTDVNLIPYKVGNSYTISCWARCTSGSGRVRLYYRNNSSAVAATPTTTLSSTWKRVYGVFTPTVVDYGRVYFYANFAAGTTGTVEMCGFRLVANGDSAEATKYITAIDNDGIRVHAANNPTSNYAKVDANGMEVYKGGNRIAKFGQTIELSDGTTTLYEIKPLSGASKLTRVYNTTLTDTVDGMTDIIYLGRTISSWPTNAVTVYYKIFNSSTSTFTTGSKSYTPTRITSGTIISEVNFKYTFSAILDTNTSSIELSFFDGTTLEDTESIIIERVIINFNTTQTVIESTLGAYPDTTQSAVFRIGSGISSNQKSNALSVDWGGNMFLNGDIYANCNNDSTGGVSLGTVRYLPSAYNYENDSGTIHLDIGVYQIGMIVLLDIECWRDTSIAAGNEIFNLDISKSEIPVPEGYYFSGMMFYNNRPLGIRILEGESSGEAGIRFRIRNCSASAVTVSSSNDGARGNLMYISSGQTCADYYYEHLNG